MAIFGAFVRILFQTDQGSPVDHDGIRTAMKVAVRADHARWLAFAGMVMAALAAPAHAQKADVKTIITTVCAGCHGADGNSPAPTFPKLAGLNSEYVVRELKNFKSSDRRSDVMSPIVATLDSDDFKAFGDYFAAQKRVPGKVVDIAAANAGAKLYRDGDEQRGVPSCGGCHGSEAEGTKRFPRLAGQHREYLIEQLKSFRSGKRDYAAARSMREVAKRMTDDDIKATAEYLQGL